MYAGARAGEGMVGGRAGERRRSEGGGGSREAMASIGRARMQLLRVARPLALCSPRPSHPVAASPIPHATADALPLSSFSSSSSSSASACRRLVVVPSFVRFAASTRRDLSVVRGRRDAMDGEAETARAGALDSKIEEQVVVDDKKIEQVVVDDKEIEQVVVDDKKIEQVVVDDKKIEQEENNDVGDGNENADKKEEVESREGEWFRLTGTCSLVLHRGDITKWFKDGKTDAIVNAANERMLGGGGVDGAIHRAAGKGLFDACFKVPEVQRGIRCPVGSAHITPGFNLQVSHIIHTVGPMYYNEGDPAKVLAKAYKSSVNLAIRSGVKYIAFPAISCGVYGYPYDEAAEVSIQALRDSAGELSEVHFVLFEAGTYSAWLAEASEKLERL